MTTKHHQTDNINMAKRARKNKKYGRYQILQNYESRLKQKWSLANYFENLETT